MACREAGLFSLQLSCGSKLFKPICDNFLTYFRAKSSLNKNFSKLIIPPPELDDVRCKREEGRCFGVTYLTFALFQNIMGLPFGGLIISLYLRRKYWNIWQKGERYVIVLRSS